MGHANTGAISHTSCGSGSDGGERGPPIPRIEPATVMPVHYASPGPQHRIVAAAAAPSPESVQAIAAAVAGMIRGQGLIGAANAMDMSPMTTPSTCASSSCVTTSRIHSQQSTSRPPTVPRCPSPPTLRVPSRSPPSSSRLQLSPFRERRQTPTIQPPPSLRNTLPSMSTSQMAKQMYSPPTSFRQRRSLAVPSSVGTPNGSVSGSFVSSASATTFCSKCGATSVRGPPASCCGSATTSSGGSAVSIGGPPWAHGGGGQVRSQAEHPHTPSHSNRQVSPARGAAPHMPLAAAAAAATARAAAAPSVVPHRQSPTPLSGRSVMRC